ncbi:hypothetical protein BDY21DRAFT_94636 [Lineolata rhizophorae]|uniref:Uncharacterized protein n=1 Tax=Lineolata rhizophorae TaxID=578093 RepID=A0A6A6NSM6_9PEZI|nr:hypothetical protein BDY21DRAFT_94636 [Lineolata rhizophorae]
MARHWALRTASRPPQLSRVARPRRGIVIVVSRIGQRKKFQPFPSRLVAREWRREGEEEKFFPCFSGQDGFVARTSPADPQGRDTTTAQWPTRESAAGSPIRSQNHLPTSLVVILSSTRPASRIQSRPSPAPSRPLGKRPPPHPHALALFPRSIPPALSRAAPQRSARPPASRPPPPPPSPRAPRARTCREQGAQCRRHQSRLPSLLPYALRLSSCPSPGLQPGRQPSQFVVASAAPIARRVRCRERAAGSGLVSSGWTCPRR